MDFLRKIGIVTAIEDAALTGWFALIKGGGRVLGGGLLFVGLVVEHILSYNLKNKRPLFQSKFPFINIDVPADRISAFSALETGIWAAALAIFAARGFAAAFAFLVVALTVEHSISDNVNSGLPLLHRVANPMVVAPSIIEAYGCAEWFRYASAGNILVGLGFLVAANFIEHQMLLKPE